MNRSVPQLLVALLIAMLFLQGCSTLPKDGLIPTGPATAGTEEAAGSQLSLPLDLPDLKDALQLATGVGYLFYPGNSEGYPAFHLLIIDSTTGARIAPLQPFPRGEKPDTALGTTDGTAVVNGSPFRWSGLPFLSSFEAAALWRLPETPPKTTGLLQVIDRSPQQGLIDYGYLSFDGTYYLIGHDTPENIRWSIGGYLPFIENGTNTGVHGQRHARTAVALATGGLLLVLVVEGKPPKCPGLTSRELGELLLHYDTRDAINLDGGNSTALAIRSPATGKAVITYRGKRRKLPLYLAIYPGS